MKKSFVLLPLLAFALVGCGGNNTSSSSTSGSTSTGPVGGNFDITLQTTGYDASEYTYSLDPVDFEAGGVAWTTSGKGSDNKGTFGGVTQTYNPDWYAAVPTGIMQIKRQTGYLENVGALSGFTKVTIKWHATYATEGTTYFPVVKCGADKAALANASCEQTTELSGTSLGVKDGKEGETDRHDVYVYTTSYVVSSSDAYFKVMSGASASYIEKISFSK